MSKETQELRKAANNVFSAEGFKKRFMCQDDRMLIKKFHSYPLKTFFTNLITLFLFVAFLFACGNPDPENYMPFIFLIAGAFSIFIVQKIFPPYYRKAVALAMMTKYKTPQDTEKNPFYYYYRQEYKVLGNLKKSGAETFFTAMGVIVKIVNIFFNLLTAVLFLAFALVIAIMWGGVLWIFHIIAGGNQMILRAAKFCCIPAKWAFHFLIRVITLKDFIGNKESYYTTSYFDRVTKDTWETKPNKMGTALSDTMLREYISLSGVVLPGSCHWNSTPSVQVSLTNVYIKGSIAANANVYKSEVEVSQLLDKCHDIIEKEVSEKIQKFKNDYPNASAIKLEVELDGYRT